MQKLIEDGVRVDMVLTDPPYQVLNKSNESVQWDKALPFREMWESINKIAKENAAIILFAQGIFSAELMLSNKSNWRYNLIWKKGERVTGFLNSKRMPLRNHEDICVFYKKLPIYNPQFETGFPNHKRGHGGGKNRCYGDFDNTKSSDEYTDSKYPKSVLNFDKEHDKWFHPTQKPVALLEYLIKTYTNEGDTVLDFTMGSGSTGVACLNTNRNFIGIEMDENYFSIAIDRIDPL